MNTAPYTISTTILKDGREGFLVDFATRRKHRIKFAVDGTYAQAVAKAEGKLRLIQAAGREAAHLTDRQIADALTAYQLLEPAGLDLLRVVRAAVDSAERASGLRVTLTVAYESYLESLAARNLRLRSRTDAEGRLAPFIRAFGARPAHTITPAEIAAWLRENCHSAGGYAARRRYLSALFAFALRRGMIEANPVAAVETPKVDIPPPEYLTVEQGRTLLHTAQATDLSVARVLALGMFAGLRTSEALALPLDAISGDAVHVPATVAKTRRARLVPVEPRLRAVLAGKFAGDIIPPAQWRARRDKVVAAAGITVPHNACRHSYATYHVAAYGEPGRTMSNMGHVGDARMFETHYRAATVRREDGRAWFGLS